MIVIPGYIYTLILLLSWTASASSVSLQLFILRTKPLHRNTRRANISIYNRDKVFSTKGLNYYQQSTNTKGFTKL